MIDLTREALRVIDGDAEGVAVHGSSTRSNLTGVTAGIAAARPIAGSHSIWELVAHIKAGREWSLARLKGEKRALEWWPPIRSQMPADWASLLGDLKDVQSRILAALPEESGPEVQAAVRFLIRHERYRSGQRAILRRASGLAGRPG